MLSYTTIRRFSQLIRRPPLAFVFDIDGVLLRGPKVLPAGRRALQILEGDNPFRAKIPYLFLTNGGGVSEQERAIKLSKKLQIELEPSQCLQAHTILKRHAHKYRDKHVLVLGGRNAEIRTLAEQYGVNNVHNTLDILAWDPSVWPLYNMSEAEKASTRTTDFSQTHISAIFVFHDPRNWALDVQVLCDIIQSGGTIGAPYVPHSERNTELVFCNPDLIYKAEFGQPRLGQGAFKDAFQAVYTSLAGTAYPHVQQYGKPTAPTHKFAEDALMERVAQMYPYAGKPAPTVYMIGDNPESDIAGANRAGWQSVLVHTGVYDPASGPPAHIPTIEAEDVEKAVQRAIEVEVERRHIIE